jgi:hypothetical protein
MSVNDESQNGSQVKVCATDACLTEDTDNGLSYMCCCTPISMVTRRRLSLHSWNDLNCNYLVTLTGVEIDLDLF